MILVLSFDLDRGTFMLTEINLGDFGTSSDMVGSQPGLPRPVAAKPAHPGLTLSPSYTQGVSVFVYSSVVESASAFFTSQYDLDSINMLFQEVYQ